MKDKQTILVVDDDPNIAQLVKLYLEKEGYEVNVETRGDDAVAAFQKNPPNLMLLDIMLPGMDGFTILERVRAEGVKTPVMMLTARGDLQDRIRGLEGGADYYLPKPFQMGELVACLRAITRRGDGAPVMNLSFGGVSLSEKEGKLQNDASGQSVKLGAKEYQLMEVFLRNPGQILPKEMLIERVWGYDSDAEYNNLEVYVSFLRKKLGFIGAKVKLKATRGLGYSLEESRD